MRLTGAIINWIRMKPLQYFIDEDILNSRIIFVTHKPYYDVRARGVNNLRVLNCHVAKIFSYLWKILLALSTINRCFPVIGFLYIYILQLISHNHSLIALFVFARNIDRSILLNYSNLCFVFVFFRKRILP